MNIEVIHSFVLQIYSKNAGGRSEAFPIICSYTRGYALELKDKKFISLDAKVIISTKVKSTNPMGFCVFVIIVNHIITQTHTIQEFRICKSQNPTNTYYTGVK